MTGRISPQTTLRPGNPIVLRLTAVAKLSEPELDLLAELGRHRETHRPGDELLIEGDPARRPRFILSGWASNQHILSDGRRQVFNFALPGDGLGVYPRMAPPALYTSVAHTPMETVDATPFLEAVRQGAMPGLVKAFSAVARLEDKMLLDQILRLGRQTAYERVAHFLLEIEERLSAVGLSERRRFPLPLTQEILADALGLSVVHVNRTLQQLRRDGLIEWRSGVATLLDRDPLMSAAEYHAAGRKLL
jgi:CRP-like cAMP-binding protein